MNEWLIRFEFKLADMWVGAFWRKEANYWVTVYDVWVCLIPCVPLHITLRKDNRVNGKVK